MYGAVPPLFLPDRRVGALAECCPQRADPLLSLRKNTDFARRRVPPYDTHPAARPRSSILSKTLSTTRISNTAPHASQGRRIRRGLRPHAPTLQRALAPQLPRRDEKRRSGPTVNVEAVCDLTRDVPESLHSFQSSNSLWFADFIRKFELVVVCGSASTPASSCNSKEAPRQRLRS